MEIDEDCSAPLFTPPDIRNTSKLQKCLLELFKSIRDRGDTASTSEVRGGISLLLQLCFRSFAANERVARCEITLPRPSTVI